MRPADVSHYWFSFLQNLSSRLEERHVTFLGIKSPPVLSVCDNYDCTGSHVIGHVVFLAFKNADLVGIELVNFSEMG